MIPLSDLVPKKPKPIEPHPSVVEVAKMEEDLGIKYSTSRQNQPGTGPDGANKYDPKALSPIMLHIMDLQFFNPTATTKELAELVDMSVSHVQEIIGCGMYKTKYKLRRLDVERLQNSRIAEERERFRKLRDKMIKQHRNLIELDPNDVKYKGKELEVQKLRQRSISDVMGMSTAELRELDRKLAGPGNGPQDAVAVEAEIDTSDPKRAYMRLMAGFRKGTK